MPRVASHEGIFSGAPISFVGREDTSSPKNYLKACVGGYTTTGFPAKWWLWNEHYPDLSSASTDWLRQISLSAGPIRSTTQTLVVTHHQYGISVLISQTSFRKETSADVAKGWLLSQATCTCVPVFQATTVCSSLVLFLILQGGDADTNGAVAGALLGCKLGSSALPPTWLKGLKHKGWLDGHITK